MHCQDRRGRASRITHRIVGLIVFLFRGKYFLRPDQTSWSALRVVKVWMGLHEGGYCYWSGLAPNRRTWIGYAGNPSIHAKVFLNSHESGLIRSPVAFRNMSFRALVISSDRVAVWLVEGKDSVFVVWGGDGEYLCAVLAATPDLLLNR